MAIRDQILQAANEIAGRMQADLFDLDRRLAEAKKHVAKIEKECDAARGAPERLSNFPIQLGSDYLCPRCWIEEGRRSNVITLGSKKVIWALDTSTGHSSLRLSRFLKSADPCLNWRSQNATARPSYLLIFGHATEGRRCRS